MIKLEYYPLEDEITNLQKEIQEMLNTSYKESLDNSESFISGYRAALNYTLLSLKDIMRKR